MVLAFQIFVRGRCLPEAEDFDVVSSRRRLVAVNKEMLVGYGSLKKKKKKVWNFPNLS